MLHGAGKGMHSRLYTRVLNQFPWMVNCTAISSLYNDTGIFSIFASAESESADEMVNVLCKELQVCKLGPRAVYLLLYLLQSACLSGCSALCVFS